jgi:hypothetical protein
MPSITPSHLYTFVALLAVSGLLVFSFMAYTDTLRFSSETKQLKTLMNGIAAKCTELLTLTSVTNASVEAFVQMPTSIGSKQYWIQLNNDTAQAWLIGALGDISLEQAELQMYLPKEACATGQYVAGHGAIHLECQLINAVPNIQITNFAGEN